jgi:hypothetical protein
MTDLTIEQHLSNLGAFIDDAEHFELADDGVVDVTEACAAFHAISAEIASLRAELAAHYALCLAEGKQREELLTRVSAKLAAVREDRIVAVNRLNDLRGDLLARNAELAASQAVRAELELRNPPEREEAMRVANLNLSASLAAARQDAERMRNALLPFVAFISAYPRPRISVSAEDTIMMSTKHGKLTLAHFDEARAALQGATVATPSLGSPD